MDLALLSLAILATTFALSAALVPVSRRLALRFDVIDHPRLSLSGRNRAFESRALLQHLLGPLLIVPEIGRGGLLF